MVLPFLVLSIALLQNEGLISVPAGRFPGGVR